MNSALYFERRKRYYANRRRSKTLFEPLGWHEITLAINELRTPQPIERLREIETWAHSTACFEVLLVSRYLIRKLEADNVRV